MVSDGKRNICLAMLLGFSAALDLSHATETAARVTGPWNVKALKKPPKATWGPQTGLVQQVYYEGEPFEGKPTQVFAYYSRPAQGDGPFPAMLLVHGGGGAAFANWAKLWAERGYIALAMDLAGHGPDGKRLPDGGPDQDHPSKFREFGPKEADKVWTYHAVAAVIRGHSLLASRQEVDADRIGITGISWGGYLTCIVAGLDDRIKVAVPVYGCGFVHESSAWLDQFAKMSEEQRARWIENFDPSRYMSNVRCPMLFMNGTNDFAYPLDSYQKTYRLIPGRVTLSIPVRMPHGHEQGWAPKEIGIFVDSVLKGGDPLPRISEMKVVEGKVSAAFASKTPISKGQLHYTNDSGPWRGRSWQSVEAQMGNGVVWAELPGKRPILYYLSITDTRDATVSAAHQEIR